MKKTAIVMLCISSVTFVLSLLVLISFIGQDASNDGWASLGLLIIAMFFAVVDFIMLIPLIIVLTKKSIYNKYFALMYILNVAVTVGLFITVAMI